MEEVVHSIIHHITEEEGSEEEVMRELRRSQDGSEDQFKKTEKEVTQNSAKERREGEARGVSGNQVMDAMSEIVEDISCVCENFHVENPTVQNIFNEGPHEETKDVRAEANSDRRSNVVCGSVGVHETSVDVVEHDRSPHDPDVPPRIVREGFEECAGEDEKFVVMNNRAIDEPRPVLITETSDLGKGSFIEVDENFKVFRTISTEFVLRGSVVLFLRLALNSSDAEGFQESVGEGAVVVFFHGLFNIITEIRDEVVDTTRVIGHEGGDVVDVTTTSNPSVFN